MTINSLVNTQSNKYPDKLAIKWGETGVTYARLNKSSSQLARFLTAQGLNENDIVAFAGDRTPELIIFLLAFVKLGITYLPIDNNLPIDRIQYMLNDADIKLLVTSKNNAEKYENTKHILFTEDAIASAAAFDESDILTEPDAEGIGYILYTSGSTGRPKGVLVKRGGVMNLLQSIQQSPGIAASDVMLFTTTISFDIAELEMFLPLVNGATIVIADAETVKDGRALVEMAKREQVTIMQGTPFMWRMMLEAGWDDALPIKAFCGGEAMTRQLAAQLAPLCNELWNMYGPTETTVYSVIRKITGDEQLITIGKPILNTQIYLLDENQKQVIDGETGEIYIGGDGVGEGYLNKPDLTAERFIADTFSDRPGQKIYKTGDLGKILPDGDILCLGRVDHQIKIRGYRIEAEEIEAQLKECSGVSDALVVVYTDVAENMHLVAYVVPSSMFGDSETPKRVQQWKDYLGKVLPVYMVPDIFMPIAAIPVMQNGKTDRKGLPQPVVNNESDSEYVAPQTETEIALSEIFLKNIAIDRIGIFDNFFYMGIDSLVMVKVMVQIEKKFDKRYPLSILIRYPTLQQLAGLIESNIVDSQYKSLIPIKPKGNKVPLYIVHGIGLNLLNMFHMVSMLDEEQPVYGLQAIGLDGTVEPMHSIEEIAAFYNSEILMNDPVGPYAISGYSFGGYIAFEMVKQLRAAGKEVKMLALFDTNLQKPAQQLSLMAKIKIKAFRQVKKLLFRLQTLFICPGKTLHYLWLQVPVYYYEFLNFIGINIRYNPNQVPGYMQDIMQQLQRAFAKYIFKSQDIKIDLFKASVKLYYVDDPKYFGWDEYATQGVDVHVVPGDHREMFIAPNDKFLAQSLQEQLDKIN
ncbi:amino acid adenylation domain-containing protein [Mucilaginibacter glaciei]|uniref:Amino acid adenylation domain-containing protein n=1 Tax=Mucilaginibacter glaciei TaxID=2772109 RepID=A0A926NGR7_9SPHI|nr:amino acid adenylation domain-containing protein [Mucilaginibacter glaciei]MBD1391784.1 amino acid adenylation domain-containing protein [Mucilaginibacter glaciei]